MKIFINDLHKLLLLGLVVTLFSGCSSMQSMSGYARTGDTITIALGGTEDSNALVEVLKKEDIVITITDSSQSTYPVMLRHLFRVYPDHSSTYIFNTKNTGGGNAIDAYAPPLLGQWIATVDLVDPVSTLSPPLIEGPATISVSSPTQMNPFKDYPGWGWGWTNGNLASIAIDILPGTGSPNTLNYLGPMSHDPVADLEPLPQLIIAPSAVPSANIAGGSFKFIYNKDDFSGGLMVVPSNHDPNVQLTSNITDLGDGTKQLDVILLNPKGFLNHDDRTGDYEEFYGPGFDTMAIGKMSPLRSVRFNIVFKDSAIANSETDWQNSIQMVSGSYIDMQGYQISDVSPIMNKVR